MLYVSVKRNIYKLTYISYIIKMGDVESYIKSIESDYPYKELKKVDAPIIDKKERKEGNSNFFYNFLLFFFVSFLVAGIIFISYMIYDNRFKSDISQNQEVTLEQNVTVNNDYAFSTPISNQYAFNPNYTIIINNYIVNSS